jgi:hypothetical protein
MNKEAYLRNKFINRHQFQTFNFNYSKIEDTLTNIVSNYTEKQNINLILNTTSSTSKLNIQFSASSLKESNHDSS